MIKENTIQTKNLVCYTYHIVQLYLSPLIWLFIFIENIQMKSSSKHYSIFMKNQYIEYNSIDLTSQSVSMS